MLQVFIQFGRDKIFAVAGWRNLSSDSQIQQIKEKHLFVCVFFLFDCTLRKERWFSTSLIALTFLWTCRKKYCTVYENCDMLAV